MSPFANPALWEREPEALPYTICSCQQCLTLLTCMSCRYLPAIGRFLIVVTFLEDALRIITQWSDQLLYLHDYRHSMAHLDLGKTRAN
jgi:hypothetical protein